MISNLNHHKYSVLEQPNNWLLSS